MQTKKWSKDKGGSKKQYRWSKPYPASFTGVKFYPAKKADDGVDMPAAYWLFFDLDRGDSLPMKYRLEGKTTRTKAFTEALEAIGYSGPTDEVDVEKLRACAGNRVLVKMWLDNSGGEFDSVTYVNKIDGGNEATVPF